jgi:Skp family chaperone for outer membrane proteins
VHTASKKGDSSSKPLVSHSDDRLRSSSKVESKIEKDESFKIKKLSTWVFFCFISFFAFIFVSFLQAKMENLMKTFQSRKRREKVRNRKVLDRQSKKQRRLKIRTNQKTKRKTKKRKKRERRRKRIAPNIQKERYYSFHVFF